MVREARPWLRTLLIATAMSLGFSASAHSAEDPSLQKQLVARIQARLDAFATGDRLPWKRDLDPNALIVDEEGNVRTPATFLAWLRPLPSGSSGMITATEVHFSQSGDVAVVAYIAREHESIYNAHFAARFSFVDAYREKDGQWRLILEQQLRMQMDPPTIRLTAAQMKPYVGRYSMAGAPYVFAVSIVNGQLVGATEGSTPLPMYAIAEQPNMFFHAGRPALYIFIVRNGRAASLIDRRYYNRDARYDRIDSARGTRE